MNKKALIERRNELNASMQEMLEKAQEEKRAMTEEEDASFSKMEEEIRALDKTIARFDSFKGEQIETQKEETRSQEDIDKEVFEGYIRNMVEHRADTNITLADNGAVVPTTIANKIIEKVVEICPIYSMAERYNVAGNLDIPYYDETAGKITMAYADEFTELESNGGKFKSISLTGFLAGCLTKVSKSLINKTGFNLTDYVVTKMAQAISLFIENELLHGTDKKVEGLKGITQVVTAGATNKITSDELMDLQDMVVDAYQLNACFIMNRTTRNAIRKLKDSEGNYMLNRDLSAKWGYTLLGKDVYTSDAMDQAVAGKDAIFYGDFSGLACKVVENINIQVLLEKYATQHAIGVVGWVELDAKVQDAQKIAKLTMKAGA